MVQRLVIALLLMAACRAQGIISTIAGNGTEGFSGNGGPATAAALAAPQGVAVDAAGNVYFAETVNYLVRMVNPAGVISSAAGCFPTTGACIQAQLGNGGPATGAFMSPFDVATDKAGNFYFPDGGHDNIRKVTPAGILSTIAGSGNTGHTGDGGPATSATLNGPLGMSVDGAGNLFFADLSNNCIRKVSASGVITTVAGNGTFGFRRRRPGHECNAGESA